MKSIEQSNGKIRVEAEAGMPEAGNWAAKAGTLKNDKSYRKLDRILNESTEGIFFAVASPGTQKKIAAMVKGSGKAAVFDYLDLPREYRYYSFPNIRPAFTLYPGAGSFFFFNAQEALKTKEDFIQLNFSRDMLSRQRRNIIFFATRKVYDNVIRTAPDLFSFIKLRLFFEDEEGTAQRTSGTAKGTAEGAFMEEMERLRDAVRRGEKTVEFGRYPRGPYGEAGPLAWRVLAVDKSRILLVTRDLVDARPYNEGFEEVTWETCTLRRWMNEVFLRDAFGEGERENIVLAKADNPDNRAWGAYGGDAAQDRVFALSIREVEKQFKNGGSRLAQATPYAEMMGARTMTDCSGSKKKDARKAGWWWLRSPGFDSIRAAAVDPGGVVYGHGIDVDDTGISVRPALWLQL